MKNFSVVFMGSPDFAVPVLQSLAQHFTVKGVVTQPDKPAGRGRELTPCPVKEAALALNLPVIQPVKLKGNVEALEQIKQWKPDVIVVAAFGKLLRRELLDLPDFGCINVHASLLPRWRGASPIQAAILYGDRQTGVTIMRMEEGLDTGPMLSQASLVLDAGETAETLETRLADLGANLLIRTLPVYLQGELQPTAQPENGATYAPLLKKEDGALDFTQPVDQLERQVRAYHPWPGCFLPILNGNLKIIRAYALADQQADPGKRMVIDKNPAVGARSGYLVFSEVQPAGKKAMDGKSFLMGYRSWLQEGDR